MILRRQRGVILFIALIVLVAMSLAGVALIRGVDNANLIAGNLAFRQGATHAADWGVELARTWLNSQNTVTLYSDQPGVTNGSAYWANMQSNLDFTGRDTTKTAFDWSTASTAAADGNGNDVQFVIHRLCDGAGDPAGKNCIRSSSGGSSSSTKGGTGPGVLTTVTQLYYRITTRVVGPRNTVSYVQVVVN